MYAHKIKRKYYFVPVKFGLCNLISIQLLFNYSLTFYISSSLTL